MSSFSSLIKNQPAAWGKKNSVEPSRTRNLCNQSSTSESSTGNSPGKGVHRCQVENCFQFQFLGSTYIHICMWAWKHTCMISAYVRKNIHRFKYIQVCWIYRGIYMYITHTHTSYIYCTLVHVCLNTHIDKYILKGI